MGLREQLNEKPWLGWSVAGVAVAVAVYFAVTSGSGRGRYTPDQMTEIVTIRFTDTNDTMDIPRGRLVSDLMLQGKSLDPSQGIINPKTGQPTGFPYSKGDWEAMIRQINADRERIAKSHPNLPDPTKTKSP